ncbi:MAG: redoxin domain-containing protein [Planctomycetes bacterium]|nr:redoxin domain-containing protein [Planctomycetota bacterium]
MRDFEALGVQVLGVSFDDHAGNARFAAEHEFGFPLLCDVDRRLSLAYKACETASDAFPRRITYVIGVDGRIEQAIATQDPGAQAAQIASSLSK